MYTINFTYLSNGKLMSDKIETSMPAVWVSTLLERFQIVDMILTKHPI